MLLAADPVDLGDQMVSFGTVSFVRIAFDALLARLLWFLCSVD